MINQVVTLISDRDVITGTVTGNDGFYWKVELHQHPPETILCTTEELERGYL